MDSARGNRLHQVAIHELIFRVLLITKVYAALTQRNGLNRGALAHRGNDM